MIQIASVGAIFLVIVIFISFHRPLYQAIAAGIIVTVLTSRLTADEVVRQLVVVVRNPNTASILLSLYLVTCIQRAMERRDQIGCACLELEYVLKDKWACAIVASIFIGMLPSASAVILCGDAVKKTVGDRLAPGEQVLVASWFRHVPESVLPTCSSVLLMVNMSGVRYSKFALLMLLPLGALVVIGSFFQMKKIFKEKMRQTRQREKTMGSLKRLLGYIWPMILLLALIIAVQLPVALSAFIVLFIMILVCRVSWKELCRLLLDSVEIKMLGNTFLVLVLAQFILYSKMLYSLTDVVSRLPIEPYLVLVAVFFLGTIISGANSVIPIGIPLAMTMLPLDAPLIMLLMCTCHAAAQISPTHVCLTVASECFSIDLGELIRRTVPLSIAFLVFAIGYYNVLRLF